MVYDHDLDFKNDYALCGNPQGWGVTRATGLTDNPFYIGPAVMWTPLLWALHHFERLPEGLPPEVVAGCRGGLASQTLWTGPFLGVLTVWLIYRIARRQTSDGPAALTAGLLALGTPLAAYAALKPSYSHVYDAFWAAVSMLASIRAAERPRSIGRWALAGMAIGVGLLQRTTSVAYGVVPAALAIATLWGQWPLLSMSLGALGLGAFATGALPQMLVNRYLSGVYWRGAPGGPFFMHYGHAHPWLLLFAPHGSFFLAAPVAWLAIPGAISGVRARKTRTLVVALLVASAATVWVSAAASDWNGSGTFGARRLTSLAALLATPLAIALDRMRRWFRARPARAYLALGVATLVPVAFTISGAGYAQTMGKLPTDVGVSESELYGTGEQMAWSVVEQRLGALSILPGELWFRARYGLPGTSFGPASEPVFGRSSRDLKWVRDSFEVDPQRVDVTTGLTAVEGQTHGLVLSAKRATIVVASRWPFATGLFVRARAERPTRLRIGRGRAFGRTDWYGEVPIDSEEKTTHVDIPEGGFDSGINEFVFERDDAAVPVTLLSLKIEDTTSYPMPP